MYKLVLNGITADLQPDTKIAVTRSVNFLNNLEDRQANFSNTFSLPVTSTNLSIFENSEVVQSGSLIPYSKIKAELYSNDIMIMDGYAELTESGSTYEITLYDGNYSFFDDIKNLSIRELDFIDNYFDNSTKVLSQAFTSGVKYPVVDYSSDGEYMDNVNAVVDLRTLQPMIFYKTIFDKIFTTQGWTSSGDFDDIFDKLLVSLNNELVYENKLKYSGYNQTFTDSPIDAIIFNNAIYDSLNQWEVTARFRASLFGTYSFNFSGTSALDNANPTRWFVQRFDEGGTLIDEVWSQEISETAFTYSFDVILQQNQYCQLFVDSTDNVVSLTSPVIELVDYTNGMLKVSESLVDISQSDFIKIICNLTGLTPITDIYAKKVRFVSLNTIFDNKQNAVDYSDKLDISRSINISFLNDNYAQKSWFKYTNDETLDTYYLADSLLINNANLDKEKALIDIPFSMTKLVWRLKNALVPLVPILTNGAKDKTFKDWIALDGDLSTAKCTFTDTIRNYSNYSYSVPVIQDLGWDQLIPTYYSGLESVFQNYKSVECYLLLSEYDFYNFDFSKPIFIDYFGSYFYVNEITDFIDGQSTKVKLLKI